MAGEERLAACAGHLVTLAAPELAEIIQEALRDPGQDPSALVDRAQRDMSAKLRGKALRAILGPEDAWSLEAFYAAALLSNTALEDAMTARQVWDRRRTVRTRSRLIVAYAKSHISSWSRDRGLDPDEVARLQVKGDGLP